MLTIYSLGDPWYLGKVMDAIAMISGSNSGFVGASEVAALIGVFIIGFQAILRLQINIHHLLVCYIVYMGCFSITTDVAIESVYSDKTVIQKDNVPYGPAVLGSVISQIGFGLSQKMETAFSDTDSYHLTSESGGFLNPLYVINNLANWAEGGSLLELMENLPEGKDLARNYQTYLADCTTKAIYLGRTNGGKTYNDVFSQPLGPDIRFNSELYGTEFIEQNGSATVTSCKEGFSLLEKQIEDTITALDSNNAAQLKIKSKILTECKSGNRTGCLANGVTVIESVQDVLDQMRISNTTAQKFMLATVLENLKKTGLAIGFRHYQDISTANMLVQSVQQRNLQWASEGSMFLNAMRPMMAFIEGFFYAIFPFAAILILLGLFGLNIFFKYIMLLLWIQLWTPIMAIANLFIITSAKEAIADSLGTVVGSAIGLDGDNALSTYLYEDIIKICQDKIAIGSMMLAATPVLSLLIITGSVYTFTSLTNRIAGADHFNEKTLAPDVVKPAAVMDQAAMYQADNFATKATGANFTGLNIGEQAQALMSTSTQTSAAIQRQFNNSYNNAMKEIGQHIKQNGLEATFTKGSAFTQSQAFQDLKNRVDQAIDSGSFGTGVTKEDSFAIAGGLAAKLIKGISASLGTNFSVSENASINQALNNSEAIGKIINDSDGTKLDNAMQAALADKQGNMHSYGVSGETQKAFSESYSATKSIANNHTEAYSAARSLSNKNDYTSLQVASLLRQRKMNGELDQIYNKYLQRFREFDDKHDTGLAVMLESSYRTTLNNTGDAPNIAAGDSDAVAKYEALLKVSPQTNNSEINKLISEMKGDAIILGAKANGFQGNEYTPIVNNAQTSPDVGGLKTEEQIISEGKGIKAGTNKRLSDAQNHQEDTMKRYKKDKNFVNRTYNDTKKVHDDEIEAKINNKKEKETTGTSVPTNRPTTPEDLTTPIDPKKAEIERKQLEEFNNYVKKYDQDNKGLRAYYEQYYSTNDKIRTRQEEVIDSLMSLRNVASVGMLHGNQYVKQQYKKQEKETKEILEAYKNDFNKNYNVDDFINTFGENSMSITANSFNQSIINNKFSPL